MGYSISNNVRDVSITFIAMRCVNNGLVWRHEFAAIFNRIILTEVCSVSQACETLPGTQKFWLYSHRQQHRRVIM